MKKLKLPKDFLWGCAISEYQNSGAEHCPNSNWANWEAGRKSNGKPNIRHGHCSGKSCDHKNNCIADIQLVKDLGLNAIRFSIEWSKIEPEQGNFNLSELDAYSKYVDELLANDINPLITLHHFTLPIWFEQICGFEKEENIQHFVNYAKKVFQYLGPKVNLWCTINEPTIYVLQGYVRGVFPPGKTDIKLGLTVLKNLMQAHTEVYIALKSMPHGKRASISFSHQYLEFKPYYRFNPLESIVSKSLNYFLNKIILRFCTTGHFKIDIPFFFKIEYQAPINSVIDYFGLNYYSRVLIKFQLDYKRPFLSCSYPDEIMTDMPYAIYPKGLYEAIKKCSSLDLPIYVTENGVADAQDDRRELFIKLYLSSLNRAISEGIDIRGYYYWTLMDNFEWDEGFTMKFGLYKVNFETQERTLREGALFLKRIIKI